MRRWVNRVALAGAVGLVGAVLACRPTPTISTAIDPATMSMGMITLGAIEPQNCNDWLSPSWKAPLDWWNSLPATLPPKGVHRTVVGFEILFDTRSGCRKARQDMYRAGFSYDLSGQSGLKGLITKAALTYSSSILPSGVGNHADCETVTGGGRTLLILRPGSALPAAPGGFVQLPGLPPAGFPPTSQLYASLSPWIAGPVTTGLPTGVTANTVATGQGGASFTVEVTPYVVGAIDRGDPSISFMLGGSGETPFSVVPPGPTDCRTWYTIGQLVIDHY